MLMISVTKIALFGFTMLPIAFSALSVGILFASYNIAISRNPDQKDNLFSISMMAFALIETFVFLGLLIILGVYIFAK